jgi:hypothetical protein
MKKIVSKERLVLLGAGALALGITLTVSSDRVAAVGPHLECGPTRQWICVLPECPDCYDVLFEGTVCEKSEFEKQTGRVCTPE